MRMPASLCRSIRIFLLIVVGCSCLALAALVFLQLNADSLCSRYLHDFSQASGYDIRNGNIRLVLFPTPAISTDTLTVSGPEIQFSAAYVAIRPSLISLLGGNFRPSHILLIRPSLRSTRPGSLFAMFRESASPQKDTFLPRNFLSTRCHLEIVDGNCQITDEAGVRLSMEGLETTTTLSRFFNRISGKIKLHRLSLGTPQKTVALSNLSLTGSSSLSDPVHSLSLNLRSRAELPCLNTRLDAVLHFSGTPRDGLTAEGSLRGACIFDAAPIPFEISGRMDPVAEGGRSLPYADLLLADEKGMQRHLLLNNFSLGNDSAGLDAVISLSEKGPAISGRLSVTRLSLTRWLSFARWLTPGLQVALDEITEGILDFRLDKEHLSVPRISALARDFLFAGSGGVESWSKPVVALDLVSDFTDLGLALPESVGRIVPAPLYLHKPLTEMTSAEFWTPVTPALADSPLGHPTETPRLLEQVDPSAADSGVGTVSPGSPRPQDAVQNTPSAPQDSGLRRGNRPSNTEPSPAQAQRKISGANAISDFFLGYDIRLKANKIHYGYFNLENGSVVITPEPVTPTGERPTSLVVGAKLYGGNLNGHCSIGGSHARPDYTISLDASGINAQGLHTDLDLIPVDRGVLQSSLRVTSHGRELDTFLAALKGKVTSRCMNGRLRTGNTQGKNFSELSLDLDLADAAWEKRSLGLDGVWKGHCQNGSWGTDFDLTGRIWFGAIASGGGAGMLFKNLPGSVTLSNLEAFIPSLGGKDIPLHIRGKLSCDSSAGSLGVEQSSFTLPGLTSKGHLLLKSHAKAFTAKGALHEAELKLPEFLRANFAKTVDLPSMFKQIAFSTEFTFQDASIQASGLKAKIGPTTFKGTAGASFKSREPALTFRLRADAINLDQQFQSSPAGEQPASARQNSPATAGRPWNLTFLKTFSAKGNLLVDTLTAGKLRTTELAVPLQLTNGRLTCPDIHGSFYGGSIKASLQATFGQGMDFISECITRGVDLSSMLHDRGANSLYTGKIEFTSALKASLTGPGQLPARLNGHLAFSSGGGSYQSVDQDGRPKGKPTVFSSARASGVMENGVIHTSDLSLKNEGLDISGKGAIDLNRQDMDLKLNVDMRGLPVVPVHVYGPMGNPKTSINGGMVILNTFFGIAKGIFGAIGGIFKGTANMFR